MTAVISETDRKFLGHLFNGVYEQLLPYALRDMGFEVLAGAPDERGRLFRPVVREKTLFGHVEARRITTFDFLIARDSDVFVVEATGWQAGRGVAPRFGRKSPREIEGKQGLDVVRRLLHLDLDRHECLINRKVHERQPTQRMLLWWDVEDADLDRVWKGEPFFRVGAKGKRSVTVGSLRRIFEEHLSRKDAEAPRAQVESYAQLSAALWDGLMRGDLSLLAESDDGR